MAAVAYRYWLNPDETLLATVYVLQLYDPYVTKGYEFLRSS